MDKRLHCVAVVVAAFLIGSCTYKTGRQINTAAIDDITIGKTTKQQVESMLGPPNNLNMMPDGEMWMYMTTETNIRGSNFIPYANLFHRESGHNNAQLTVSFNRKGVVTDCAFTTSTSVHTGGFAHNNESIANQVATGKRCGDAAIADAETPPPAPAPAKAAKSGKSKRPPATQAQAQDQAY